MNTVAKLQKLMSDLHTVFALDPHKNTLQDYQKWGDALEAHSKDERTLFSPNIRDAVWVIGVATYYMTIELETRELISRVLTWIMYEIDRIEQRAYN